jgi:hypothetical protein
VAALVAAPRGYDRLRNLVETSGDSMSPASDETDAGAADVAPATAFAAYDAPAEAGQVDEDTAELRLRIDETRQRIRRRAEDVVPADDDAGAGDE